jgi:hypothetical protein
MPIPAGKGSPAAPAPKPSANRGRGRGIESVEGCSRLLAERGEAVPALPVEVMAVFEQAADGKPVPETTLRRVLAAATRLDLKLAFRVLVRWPGRDWPGMRVPSG